MASEVASKLIRLSQEWMEADLFRKDETMPRENMSPDYTEHLGSFVRSAIYGSLA